jgi:hypothetical protein
MFMLAQIVAAADPDSHATLTRILQSVLMTANVKPRPRPAPA